MDFARESEALTRLWPRGPCGTGEAIAAVADEVFAPGGHLITGVKAAFD